MDTIRYTRGVCVGTAAISIPRISKDLQLGKTALGGMNHKDTDASESSPWIQSPYRSGVIECSTPQEEEVGQQEASETHAIQDSDTPGYSLILEAHRRCSNDVVGDPEDTQRNIYDDTNRLNIDIHARARRDGLQHTFKALRFLCKMMIPMAVMATLMFGLFSLLSWLIPHVLCKSFGESLSVRCSHLNE